MYEKALVRFILERALNYEWTLQGFGMLRMYLDAEHAYRLNVWDSRYRVPGVTLIHDHPWDFESLIVVGVVHQHRFTPLGGVLPLAAAKPYLRQTILTGEGGGLLGEPEPVVLIRGPEEVYGDREVYGQRAEEIHISLPEDGTVTLNLRTARSAESHAHVFWPIGDEWVSAEPRVATPSEIVGITQNALECWF